MSSTVVLRSSTYLFLFCVNELVVLSTCIQRIVRHGFLIHARFVGRGRKCSRLSEPPCRYNPHDNPHDVVDSEPATGLIRRGSSLHKQLSTLCHNRVVSILVGWVPFERAGTCPTPLEDVTPLELRAYTRSTTGDAYSTIYGLCSHCYGMLVGFFVYNAIGRSVGILGRSSRDRARGSRQGKEMLRGE